MGNNVEVRPRSRKDIRRLVSDIRKALNIENEIYVDIVRLVENVLPSISKDYSFEVCSIEEMRENHGLTVGHTIKIREDVYERAVRGEGRDRMTIAHEFGHLFMHSDAPKALARGKVAVWKDPEWQASAFAGEFLVPFYLVKGMNVYEIAEKCGVSVQAANYQLSQYQKRKTG